ncbi:MAG: acyl carrier protein [Spirochaetales bacterium]|nr:acyl carrier protein [Spirochaetales bacterium]
MKSTEEHILRIINETLGIPGCGMETPLLDPDHFIDSITLVRFIARIEEEFNINLGNDLDLEALESPKKLLTFINKEKSGAAS